MERNGGSEKKLPPVDPTSKISSPGGCGGTHPMCPINPLDKQLSRSRSTPYPTIYPNESSIGNVEESVRTNSQIAANFYKISSKLVNCC